MVRKLGFSNTVVDMIWRLISNNYYSILLNGQVVRFFHPTRGEKQGDPLSLAVFILSAEVMIRALNNLFNDIYYVGYGMPKWSSNLNHLAYEDGTIIFSSSNEYSMEKIMKILREYEIESGQKVNRGKSFFICIKCSH